ncbi:MAG: DsrE family protein [Thioalkalivibrionaceae bacterium]
MPSRTLLNALPLAAALLLAGGITATSTANAKHDGEQAANGYTHQRVIYHVNDFQNANASLRNINNHLNAVGDDHIDLVVVTHGSGINFLLDDAVDASGNTFDNAVRELAARGVRFEVCRNTLTSRNLDESAYSMLSDIVEIVPSGVATVAQKQIEGYVLVKP